MTSGVTLLLYCALSVAPGTGQTGRSGRESEQLWQHRVPLAGEPFEVEAFGRHIEAGPRDRRRIAVWTAGALVTPGADLSTVLPVGNLYLWYHPSRTLLLRAVIIGVYQDLLVTASTPALLPLEGVLTLNTLTVPFARAVYVDGERLDESELYWGWLRGGIGGGMRWQVGARGANDNMLAINLMAEPTLLYFHAAEQTAEELVVPDTTFALRARLRARLDLMTRNFMEMAHSGWVAGADLWWEHRYGWRDWGVDAGERASAGREPSLLTGYLVGAARVPLLDDRHHVLGSVHLGIGHDLDRFSKPRLGGGPGGQDYGDLSRPLLPGAFIEELPTSRYVMASAEYRWQALFFTFVGVRGNVAYLRRDRFDRGGRIVEQDDVLGAVTGRLATGFLWRTQLQLDYTYNTGVVRSFGAGGHGILVHVSRRL